MKISEARTAVLTKLAAKFPEPSELIELSRAIGETDVCKGDFILGSMISDGLIKKEGTAYHIAPGGQQELYGPLED